jgi:hypothetical protein
VAKHTRTGDNWLRVLPDFPVLKDEFRKRLMEMTQRRTKQYMGLLGRIGARQLHEGKGHRLIRADGSVDEASSVAIAVPITLAASEIESLTMNDLIAKLDTAAREMAEKQSALFGERFEQSVNEVGNAINAEGMTEVEAFFKGLETVDLEFNQDGSPDIPESPQPSGQAWLKRMRLLVAEDPLLRQRYTSLIGRKREEFRDREISRKLVG